jgi:hypothetical protein
MLIEQLLGLAERLKRDSPACQTDIQKMADFPSGKPAIQAQERRVFGGYRC